MVLVEKYGLLFAMSAYVSGHKGLKMAPGLVCRISGHRGAVFSFLDLENEGGGGLVKFLIKAPDN